MAASSEPLLRYLSRLTAPSDHHASDADLWKRFVSQGDETAFTALLARHGPMVHGVCRRILRDAHDAEDAFQATFLVLARKAASLRRPEALASWLHSIARRLAFGTRRADGRRRQRETHSLASAAPPAQADLLDDLSARELLLALDEEMARLPETYRLPLILCHLEGRTHEEAARLLGWTMGSIKGRLERGRKRLHQRLSRRGLELSGAMLALGGSQGGSATVAARSSSATLQAALAFARGERGGIAAAVLALAESGVANMMMAKAKLGLLLLAMGLAAGAGALAYPLQSEKQPEAKPAAPPSPRRKSETPKSESDKQARTDRYGDPLPPGALTRLGTIRLRHGGHVMAVAFTPDGKSVVSGGFDGWAFLWDAATGKRLRAFRQHSIKSVAIDPKGKTVALANNSDGTIKLYGLATGKERATFPGHRVGTEIVVFSPDGKLLASGGRGKDMTIRLWDVAKVRQLHCWPANRVHVPSLRFTPNGKSLACLDEEGTLRFRDVATGTERRPSGPLATLKTYSFCFDAVGKVLVTGGSTTAGLLQLWDAANGKEIRTIARTKSENARIVLAPDGKSVWTADIEGDVRQWDLATGKLLLHLSHPPYTRMIEDLALSADGKRLAAGTYSHDVFLWDTTTGRRLSDFAGHRFLTTAAVFTSDGQHLWTGGYDETIRSWSAASGEQLRLLSLERNKGDMVYSLALRSDGKMLAAGVIRKKIPPNSPPCDVRLWDVKTGKEQKPLHGHGDWVRAVAFSPDGRMLASRGEDQTIRLWDVAAGKEVALLRCGKARAAGIAFSHDGRRVISTLDKETIGFWDVESGRLTRRLSAGSCGGNGIPLLSRDGRMLVTGGGEQPLRVWDVASGKERCRIERPNAKAYIAAALSPDCRVVAWCEYGQSIKVWDLIDGKQLGELGDQTNMADVLSLTFSADSRHLASTHSDGTGLIWDVARLLPKAAAPTRISAKRLEALWNELAGKDSAKAYDAIRTLAATPAQSVPLLRQRLPKTMSVDAAKIARLLVDLDSEQFEVRERATRGLQDLGMPAEAAMRRALRKRPSLEARRRLEQILDKLESGERMGEELRILRAVEVLELVGSTEARQALRERSQGPGDDWLTLETKASLARLAARK